MTSREARQYACVYLRSDRMAERGVLWTDQETKLLIAVWADKGIQKKMDSTKETNWFFEEIAKKMSADGVFRSAKQCRIKLKALKTEYKKNYRSQQSFWEGEENIQVFWGYG